MNIELGFVKSHGRLLPITAPSGMLQNIVMTLYFSILIQFLKVKFK